MKFLFLYILFNQSLFAKDITEYNCELNPEQSVELSLIDPRNPSLVIKNKDKKIARCFYQTLPKTKLTNKLKVTNDLAWHLQISKCDNYNEKLAKTFKMSTTASFKQSQKMETSYLRLFKDQHPLACKPKAKI